MFGGGEAVGARFQSCSQTERNCNFIAILLRFNVEIGLMFTSVVSYVFYMLFVVNTVSMYIIFSLNLLSQGSGYIREEPLRGGSPVSLSWSVITHSVLVRALMESINFLQVFAETLFVTPLSNK